MAIVTKTRTYLTGDALPANYYNADRDEIIAGINSIDNAQISSTAAIQESKIVFSGSGGHRHGGGTDGRKVRVVDLDPSTLTANYFLKVNAGGTAIESVAGISTLVTSLDPTGLTPNLPLVINAGGTAVISRALVDADIDAAAAIQEAKVLFDTVAGHNHDGLNSAPITVALPRSFVFTDYQELLVEDNIGVNPIVEEDMNFDAIYAYVKEAPVGADLVITVTLTDLTLVATITIPDGENFASAAVAQAVAAGTFLQMNVTQVGSTTPGSFLTVTLSGLTA